MAATFLVEEIFELYVEYHVNLLSEGPSVIYTKLWWDERRVKGSLQTVAGISPIWPLVRNHSSWTHLFPFLLAHPNCVETLPALFQQSGLFELLEKAEFTTWQIPHRDESCVPGRMVEAKVKFFVVLDWMCFYTLNQACCPPSSNNILQNVCPCCGFNVGDKIGGWRKSPWAWYPRDAAKDSRSVATIINCFTVPLRCAYARTCTTLFSFACRT